MARLADYRGCGQAKERAIAAGLGVWFVAQSLFFALWMAEGIAPDEQYHLEVSELWAKGSGLSLPTTEPLYRYGALERAPYLYHLIMGGLLRLVGSSVDHLVFLRLMSVGLSALTFGLTYVVLKRLLATAEERLLVLVILCQTPMFVFMSGMVSYDNLVLLLAMTCFLLLAMLIQDFRYDTLLALALVMCVGTLTKITFVPLALFLTLAAFWLGRARLVQASFYCSALRGRSAALTAFFFVGFVLNCSLYGTNVLSYGGLYPSCDRVYSASICAEQYGQYARDLRLVSENQDTPRLSLPAYLPKYWKRAWATIYGVIGHRTLPAHTHDKVYYFAFWGAVLTALVALVAQRRWDAFSGTSFLAFALIACAYVAVVIFEAYEGHRVLGTINTGLQGRYLFPVYVPALVTSAHLLCFGRSARTRLLLLVGIALLFATGGIAQVLRNADASWFR